MPVKLFPSLYNMRKTRRRAKLKGWVKRSKQKGGFLFVGIAAIASAIAAAVSAAAPAVATGALTAAAAYGTKKALEGTFGKGRRRQRKQKQKH
jgi:hypothetical protein